MANAIPFSPTFLTRMVGPLPGFFSNACALPTKHNHDFLNTAPYYYLVLVLAVLGEEGATPARLHISELPTASPIFPLRDSPPPPGFLDGELQGACLVHSASVERNPRLVACDPGSARTHARVSKDGGR